MKAVDLVGHTVYDPDGDVVGQVHDLVFRYRPPRGSQESPRFELIALECGKAGVGHRFGYAGNTMAGPWPLPALFRWLARRTLLVDWGDVRSVRRSRIDIAKRAQDLRRVTDQQ